MKYIECYSGCNCSADANRKADLPGYCGTHGGDRKRVYGPLLPTKRKPRDPGSEVAQEAEGGRER